MSLPGVAGSPSVLVGNSQSVSQLPGQPVASLSVPVPQLVEKMGKKPITPVSKSSHNLVPKVVQKKRAVTPHEVSSSSFSFYSAVPVPDPGPDPSTVHVHAHALLLALGSQGLVCV